jgi:hypothetical protein
MTAQIGVSYADVDTKGGTPKTETATDGSPQKLVIKMDASEGKRAVRSASLSIESDNQNTNTSTLCITIACDYPVRGQQFEREIQDLYLKLAFLKGHGYDCTLLTEIDDDMRAGKKPLPSKGWVMIRIPLSKEKMPEDVQRGLVTVIKDHFYVSNENAQKITEFLEKL